MFDMTPAVARALEVAQRWARHEQVEVLPAHLLQGLLEEEEGRPWLLLTQAGLDPRLLRKPVPPDADAFSLDTPGFSTTTSAVLRRARGLTRGLGEEQSVASEHVLFALLEVDEALRQALESQGLKTEKLEADVWEPQGPPIQLDEPLLLDEASDLLYAGRILDASANRAREALRVLEDFARFALDDAFLSGELKRLRHGLAETLALLPSNLLLEARDTLGDVGTRISTPQEMRRSEPLDIVRAACKRLQEALRSIEEYGKLVVAEVATQAEALRYRAYTLERTLLLREEGEGEGEARARLAAARLYVLVTSANCRSGLETTVREAIAGGAQVVQLREKQLDDRQRLALARDVRRWCHQAGALFILNDRPDLARLCDADGVHLGQEDLPVREARRILGPKAVIGVSTHNLDQLRQAILDGAHYVGVGPVFLSSTKKFDGLAGLAYLEQAIAETSLPAFAIGGITAENLASVVAVGALRVAVSAAVCQADDPRQAAAALRRVLG